MSTGSGGQLARNRSLSMSSGGNSSKGRLTTLAEVSMGPTGLPDVARDFEPCAATASMLLYAQGPSVVCAHHDTLTIERRFSRHQADIQILAVDTVSEKGAGRLVVSYDVGMTAIVWDCMTGDELARFASYDHLTVAAWMKNGNVAFGNNQGNVILFEPTTSEHISARTIDQIPITALAPAADCRTYAIGFANGSLLIAALQPRFTILHNLTTSRGPSPIVTLAWHASSSRQKSDMLATQTHDGDLRVWSIAKSPTSTDPAKVVRVLQRTENYQPGPNWLGWSKNGRIVQYSEGETSSWDVKTKHVTYENVPTLGDVRGIAVYGPGATLFTLGRNNTAQQFDLNSPPVLVANVQHPANLLPPSPPVSIEEQKKRDRSAAKGHHADIEGTSIPVNVDVSESDEDHMSPLARIAREMDKLEEHRGSADTYRGDTMSPVSSRSQTSSTSRSSAGSRPYKKHASVLSAGYSDGTTMSIGSSMHSAQTPSLASTRDSLSTSSLSSRSNASSSKARPRASRLRQEVLRSPEDNKVVDLFKFTKTRLSDIPYRHPQVLDNTHLTNDDLRRQMLSTIFGWDGEPETLIQDEMGRHPLGSTNRVLLAKWLGDIDTDIMTTSSESMTSSDWMLLALSGIGGQASQTKVARAYVQRLLEKGDVHTAATIMIGMGDQNDAIEIYVSHKRYMEALILTALEFPQDWQRQAELVRKWGEWAVQHSQQQLAIRCFSCTGSESSEPWSSPTAQAATFSKLQSQSIPEILSPPLSPPGSLGPQRSIAKTSALKLITSFGDKAGKSKFFGIGEDDRTPVGGHGVTPIAESALSPGDGDTAHTAFLRPGLRSAYNTPASARTATPGGFTRHRLPSIGEMPSDVLPLRTSKEAKLPTPADSGSDAEKSSGPARAHERKSSQPEVLQLTATTYAAGMPRAATASPMMQREHKLPTTLPSPSPELFTASKQNARTRNGSRDRKPDGLQIHWPPMESIITGDYMTSPGSSVASSRQTALTARSRDTSRSMTASLAATASGRSPTVTASERSFRGTNSPVVTGRSLDQYISSLESAQHHAQKQRTHRSRDRTGSSRTRSSSRKAKRREPSEDRGRVHGRYVKSGKRSPTSPLPMSPEDLRDLGAVGFGNDGALSPLSTSRKSRNESRTREKTSKPSSRVRQLSSERPVRVQTSSKPGSRVASRNTSRRRNSPESPVRLTMVDARGRSKGREGSAMRSPSSPLPMSPQQKFYQADDDDDDFKKAFEEQKRFRSRNRSTSRVNGLKERGSSAHRDQSPDRRRQDRSTSRHREREASRTRNHAREGRPQHTRALSDHKLGHNRELMLERQLKKEQAARELEERRRSLVRRPSVPPIVHPEELARLSPMLYRPASTSPEYGRTFAQAESGPSRQQIVPPPRSSTTSPGALNTNLGHLREASSSTPQIGLPATPRAMRHPKYDPDGNDIPDVPQIPVKYDLGPPWMATQQGTLPGTGFGNLAPLLPKTTYQAAPRRLPPRSASAPVPEEPLPSPSPLPAALPTHPAFQAALPPSSQRPARANEVNRIMSLQSPRKIIPGYSQPGELGYETRNNSPIYSPGVGMMGGIDETIEAGSQPINPSNNDLTPPPPPPPPMPPILKELQHLVVPPPPPPAPLYRPGNPNTNSIVSGVSQGSGVIEIVMDDDEHTSKSPEVPPLQIPGHSRHSSISGPSGPPISQHNRGRSFSEKADNSISSRFSRAAERLRSASRGKNGASPHLERTKSPQETSPYESVQPIWNQDFRSANNTPAGSTGNLAASNPTSRDGNMTQIEGGMI
ncbi:hypothetical protein BP6252_09759 [Coleophoma cylindrospora]|uniref:Gem-associated protein 5 TPR domain-containing protein n=1 Tax=Coleophoma cylindrospora TaxID=1849047 RepID=A0A3D8QX53_9HELO|nr:hypothetical protein BP6252_09759 [Coleophoma cylindrospora]